MAESCAGIPLPSIVLCVACHQLYTCTVAGLIRTHVLASHQLIRVYLIHHFVAKMFQLRLRRLDQVNLPHSPCQPCQ